MKKFTVEETRAAAESVRGETERFLCDLIRFPSLPGQESEAVEYARKRFAEVGDAELLPLSNSLRDDPDYSDPVPDIQYDGRFNLRVRKAGSGKGRKLVFNAHLDVVPPSKGQERPFDPSVESGVVYGRGACDDKGQVATIFATMAALKKLNVNLPGDLLAHLVVEEEVGGNGTLAMVRHGEKADACVVLESTSLRIHPSVRGAVWFRATCTGKPGHSSQPGSTISALKLAVRVMEILEQYHDKLLAASKGIALFDEFQNPMPLNFGRLVSGDWPATSPAQAIIEGVLGLLPNKTRQQVMDEMRQAIQDSGDPWLREHVKLEFMYRHDAHVLDPKHPLVTGLQSTCRQFGASGDIAAMVASCDSWFYNNQLGIPTVVFGPGEIRYAHTNEEQIRMDDIVEAAAILAQFAQDWCGEEKPC